MEIEIKTLKEKGEHKIITIGDIIRCKDFSYGILYTNNANKGVSVGWSENSYKVFLKTVLNNKVGIDAYDSSRGEALFLTLQMEIVEVILPEDVDEETHYLGINISCIRLGDFNKISRDAERIFFTLCHPMSCLDVHNKNVEIVDHLDLPLFWKEQSNNSDSIEKSF